MMNPFLQLLHYQHMKESLHMLALELEQQKYLPLEYGQDGFDYEDKEKFSIYSLTFEELEN